MRTPSRSTFIAAVQIAAFSGALFTGISAGAARPAVHPSVGPAAPPAAPGAPACIPNNTGRPLPAPPFGPTHPQPLPDHRPPHTASGPSTDATPAVQAPIAPCHLAKDGANAPAEALDERPLGVGISRADALHQ